jgi:hypothetical protein
MTTLDTKPKREILETAGYVYGFDREIYFNRVTKKIFSVEFVEDHSTAELEKCISENSNEEEWRFYFNYPPSDAVKRELKSVLG